MSEDHSQQLKEMAHGAGIGIFFGIFGYALSFLVVIIASRYYGPEDWGIFTLGKTILLLGATLGVLGLNGGVSRYIPFYEARKEYETLAGYVRFIFLYPLVFSIILGIFLVSFSENITNFFGFPQIFGLYLKLIGFVLPFKIMTEVIRPIMLAKKEILYQKLSQQVVENIILILGVLLILFFNMSLLALILLYIGMIIATFLFDFLVYKIKIKFREVKQKKLETKDWISFSLPLFFTAVFSFFINWTDNLMIGKFLDPAELGIYSIAFSLAMFLDFFQGNIAHIFFPLISEAYAKEKIDRIVFLFKKSAAWAFGLTFPVFLVLAVYSKQLLSLIFGKSFETGHLPLMILSVGFLIGVMTGLNRNVLLLYKKTTFIFTIDALALIGNIALNVLLIPLYGIIGAAIASGSTIVIRNVIQIWKAKTCQELEFDHVYYMKFIMAGVAAALISASIFKIGINKLVALVISGSLYCSLYLLFLLILRTFTKEDMIIFSAVEEKLGLNLKKVKRVLKKFYD